MSLLYLGTAFPTIPSLVFLLCAVLCVYDYKMDGATRALGGLRITHYGRLAGRKKVGWICSLIMRSLLAFLGMIFSLDCAYGSRNRRDIVIVAHFVLGGIWELHLAFVFLAQVALSVHLFGYLYDTLQIISINT